MISTKTEETLFKDVNPVGQIIEMKGQPMQIVGVYTSDNEFMGFEMEEGLIPLRYGLFYMEQMKYKVSQFNPKM